jgi:hypothetical protein
VPDDTIQHLGMRRRMAVDRGSVFSRACALSLLVVLLGTTSVLADTRSGTIGHYRVKDTTSSPAATCNYTSPYPNHYLVSFSVKAPSLWWPNTTSSDSREHGTVGWWPVVQVKTNGSWRTIVNGAGQQAVAYEDRPAYDSADRAPLSTKSVTWSATDQELYRVLVRAAWYRADGSAMGQVKHTVGHYRQAYTGWSTSVTGGCPGRITILT